MTSRHHRTSGGQQQNDEEIIHAVGNRGGKSAYDKMMAEIQIDSDGDDFGKDLSRRAQEKNYRKQLSSSSSFTPNNRDTMSSKKIVKGEDDDEEKVYQDHKRTSKMQAEPITTNNSPLSDSDSRVNSGKRRLSLPSSPPILSKLERRNSKSHNSDGEGDHSDDSDDSAHETEARIKNASMDLFNNAAAKIPTVVDQRSDYNTVRAFLSRAPKNGAASLRFYVVRDRQGFNMLNPIFRLFLEDGNQFLLSAQKATNNKTSNYHLSMARTPSGRRDPLTLGKLRANWSGSEYWIYDDGLNPAKTAIEANTRCILGFIEFAYDEMGPGRMNIHIPKVYDNSNISTWRDTDMEGPNRVTAKEEFQQKLDKDAVFLRNKRPVYDEKTGGHVLNFHGRITMPSVKNFQVEYDSSSDEPALQFGRVSCQPPGPRAQCKCHKNTFNMDVCFPLSPLQAFAICLSTLDGKFADQKMYDSVTKFINKKK